MWRAHQLVRLLVPLVLASCSATGSARGDRESAELAGRASAEVTASTTPDVAEVIAAPVVDAVASLSRTIGEQRATAAEERGDDNLDPLTRLLLYVGAWGGVFTSAKTATRKLEARVRESSTRPPS